ncbi:T9SS C-terminal target domain-containing protein [Flavobacterium sp.]|uniref:T9SS C-terminal target domain-containing protein n=1 Tax=Flavobacterium sp. TaxID=239 RepID=UPI0025DCCF9C|nr:T9SS C-terminal target domain-containing protein [Flavobacterium sp.]
MYCTLFAKLPITILRPLALLLFIAAFSPLSICGQEIPENITRAAHCNCRALKKTTHTIHSKIDEGSGLVAWNGRLWTHNDSGRQTLFAIDTLSGKILEEFMLPVRNVDWEEITQDRNFLYIGNFGNNGGLREQLQIYRISKEKLLQHEVVLDSISFEWPKTDDFGSLKKINFDCEAMIVVNDTILLFTKEFKKRRCSRVFRLPAKPTHHIAEYVTTLKTRTLITGATYLSENRRVVLCGYSMFLSPRMVTFNLSGKGIGTITNAKQIRVRGYFRQNEGVASFNGTDCYLISEATNLTLWRNKPRISKVTISP